MPPAVLSSASSGFTRMRSSSGLIFIVFPVVAVAIVLSPGVGRAAHHRAPAFCSLAPPVVSGASRFVSGLEVHVVVVAVALVAAALFLFLRLVRDRAAGR